MFIAAAISLGTDLTRIAVAFIAASVPLATVWLSWHLNQIHKIVNSNQTALQDQVSALTGTVAQLNQLIATSRGDQSPVPPPTAAHAGDA
jgi:hypothetical protein